MTTANASAAPPLKTNARSASPRTAAGIQDRIASGTDDFAVSTAPAEYAPTSGATSAHAIRNGAYTSSRYSGFDDRNSAVLWLSAPTVSRTISASRSPTARGTAPRSRRVARNDESAISTRRGPPYFVRTDSLRRSATAGASPGSLVQRVLLAELDDALADLVDDVVALDVVDDAVDEVADLLHRRLVEPAGRERGGARPDPRGVERRARLARDGVAVEHDVRGRERVLGVAARQVRVRVAEVDQHEVVVGPAGDQGEPVVGQRLGEDLRVVDHAPRVVLELGFERLLEPHRLAGDVVHERAALPAGEHRLVDVVGELVVAHHDPAAAGADRLVRRAGDEVRDADRRGVDARGDEAGDVRDVGEVVGVDRVGGRLDRLPVDGARIRRVAGDDDVGLELLGRLSEPLVVDVPRLGVDLVLLDLVHLPGEVRRVAVREVAAVAQLQREDLVARLERRVV